jgi:hypothetical protein
LRRDALFAKAGHAVDFGRAAHRRHRLVNQRLPLLQRLGRRGGGLSRAEIFFGRRDEKSFAIVRSENVDAALMNGIKIRVSLDRRAHPRARAVQLNLITRRVLLEGGLVAAFANM